MMRHLPTWLVRYIVRSKLERSGGIAAIDRMWLAGHTPDQIAAAVSAEYL